MEPLSLLGLGAGLAGGVAKWFMGGQAAELQRQAGLEMARRQELGYENTLGEGRAAAGASGLAYNATQRTADGPGPSSMSLYLGQMAQEFRRRNQFAVQMVNQGAGLSHEAADLGLGADVSSSFFGFARANNYWGATGYGYPPLDQLPSVR